MADSYSASNLTRVAPHQQHAACCNACFVSQQKAYSSWEDLFTGQQTACCEPAHWGAMGMAINCQLGSVISAPLLTHINSAPATPKRDDRATLAVSVPPISKFHCCGESSLENAPHHVYEPG